MYYILLSKILNNKIVLENKHNTADNEYFVMIWEYKYVLGPH